MQTRDVVTRAEWDAELRLFLQKEKALQQQRDALAAQRRQLPWYPITTDYRFDSENGEVGLAELFAGRSQLLVWHFMFAADWEEGCPSCSFWADQYSPAVPHLAARDVSLVAVSTAPVSVLSAYKRRMGWAFPWVSCADNGFNRECAATFSAADVASGDSLYNHGTIPPAGEEMPGLSVFALDEQGAVYRTYATYARGLDALNGAYQQLDLVPKGRDEGRLDYPMAWLKRRDAYGEA